VFGIWLPLDKAMTKPRANHLVARLQILVHCNFGACTAGFAAPDAFVLSCSIAGQPQAAAEPFSTE